MVVEEIRTVEGWQGGIWKLPDPNTIKSMTNVNLIIIVDKIFRRNV